MTHLWSLSLKKPISTNCISSFDQWLSGSTKPKSWNSFLLFLQNRPPNWSFQTPVCAYAHNSTPLPQLQLSPYPISFHTHPSFPSIFSFILVSKSAKDCIVTYSDSLPIITHYSEQDLDPFFRSLIFKPIFSYLLSAEHSSYSYN